LVGALESGAFAGSLAELQYLVSVVGGETRETVVISSGQRVLARIERRGFHRVRTAEIYVVRWRVPTRYAGKRLTFCVTATDRSGNVSRPSCAGLHVARRT
jgi:hypothetical protein